MSFSLNYVKGVVWGTIQGIDIGVVQGILEV